MASDNPTIESPIYVENLRQHRRHWYVATRGDAIHRIPVRPEELWAQFDSIPDVPAATLLNDGDAAGVVILRKQKTLEPVPGSALKFRILIPAPPPVVTPIRFVIPATHGQEAPLSGSADPVVGTPPAPATGYTPTLQDATGAILPYDPERWTLDGLNGYVEFPQGTATIPTSLPMRLTYFEYTGVYGGCCTSQTGGATIRQGVDCRQHYIQRPPANPPGPNATPIATYGDAVRDENIAQDGLNAERFWTKTGRRVRLTVSLLGTQLTDPTRPARIYLGELPFRQGPFLQPPPAVGGDFSGVLGRGVLSTRQPESGATGNATIVATVTADFEARTIPAAYANDPNMVGWTPAMRTFGPGSGKPETPGNAAYLILTIPGGVNPPPFGATTCFGSVELEYDADIATIHPPGYVPPIDPGTGQPYPCPYPAEYIPLL